MTKAHIRQQIDYMLAGERRLSHFLMLVPFWLKLRSFVLLVLALPQIVVVYRHFPLLGGIYVITAIMLRLLIWCSELFRDRWLVCRINGEKISAITLLVGFSFRDVFRAAVLAVVLRVYCFCRAISLFIVPAFGMAVSVALAMSGISTAVLFCVLCGDFFILILSLMFYASATASVRCAVKLSSFEKSGLVGAVRERMNSLDGAGVSALSSGFMLFGCFSASKIMSGLVCAQKVIC